MSGEQSTIRIIPFSGKDQDWNRWSKTFLAFSASKGYKDELIKESTDANKCQQAYNDLLLSCQDDITFGIVDEADGNPKAAWDGLKQKFEPNNRASLVKLSKEFQNTKLSEDEDPKEYINKMELMRRRLKTLGTDMTDEGFMIQIINNAP